jgi:transposase
MSQTASRKDFIAVEVRLLVAFELGWEKWRLAFATVMGEKPWQVVVPARDVLALTKAIGKARQRLGLSESCPVFSCYEAGREGFWLHRLLTQMGVVNLVVDSSSIEADLGRITGAARSAAPPGDGDQSSWCRPSPAPGARV